MDSVYVTEIVEAHAKSGYSEKTKKDWSMARVGLSNGESCFMFNPVSLGDVVEQKEINGYQNWVKVKVDPRHEEIMKGLKFIASQNKAILAAIRGDDAPTAPLPPKPAPMPSPRVSNGFITEAGDIEFPDGYLE